MTKRILKIKWKLTIKIIRRGGRNWDGNGQVVAGWHEAWIVLRDNKNGESEKKNEKKRRVRHSDEARTD